MMLKVYLQKLQSLRKYVGYVGVFALGALASGLAYEFGGLTDPPSRPSLAEYAPPREPSPPAPRLVEQTLPPQVEAPGPRIVSASSSPSRPTSAALRDAAAAGNLARVRELLAERINTEVPDDQGRTALYLAAMSAQSDVVRVLIQAGADVNARANDGSTPLIAAAGVGDPVIVHMLLEANANIDARDKSGTTARLLAKKRGHDVVYEFILDEAQRRQSGKNQVLRVQQHLTRLGYKVGRPDGVLGPNTVRAIRKFQSKHRLKTDGRITPHLISLLERQKRAEAGRGHHGTAMVRAPTPKPRSAARAARGQAKEQAKADDSADSGDRGWLDRAADGFGSLFSKTQAAAAEQDRACANSSQHWVRNSDGDWIECPDVPRN